MCRGIVPAEHLVEWKHRAKIEIHLLAELAIDLMHVAAELFEQALEAVEHGIERSLIAGEICADKFLECSSIAVRSEERRVGKECRGGRWPDPVRERVGAA